jgi:hypothetical protein
MPGVPDFYQSDESWALVRDRSRQPPAGRLRCGSRVARPSVRRRLCARELRAASPHDVLNGDLKPVRVRSVAPLSAIASSAHVKCDVRPDSGAWCALHRQSSRSGAPTSGNMSSSRSRDSVERSLSAAGWPAGSDFWRETELRVPSRVREWKNVLTGCTATFDQPGARRSRASRKDGPGSSCTGASRC